MLNEKAARRRRWDQAERLRSLLAPNKANSADKPINAQPPSVGTTCTWPVPSLLISVFVMLAVPVTFSGMTPGCVYVGVSHA